MEISRRGQTDSKRQAANGQRDCQSRPSNLYSGINRAQRIHLRCTRTVPCLTAIPHHFGLSGGWSPGWMPNSPACGYPAVQWVFGQEVNIAFKIGLLSTPISAQCRARARCASINTQTSGRQRSSISSLPNARCEWR